MLYLNVPVGDAVVVDNGRVVIHVEKRSGHEVRLGFDAPREVPIKVVPKERNIESPMSKGLTGAQQPSRRKSGA